VGNSKKPFRKGKRQGGRSKGKTTPWGGARKKRWEEKGEIANRALMMKKDGGKAETGRTRGETTRFTSKGRVGSFYGEEKSAQCETDKKKRGG